MSHNEKLKRMIEERRIEEAAFDFNDGELTNDKLIRVAFIYSAKWIQEEFLKNLWYQTDEEPEGYDEWILLHYNVGNYYSLSQVKDFKSWKGFVERAPIDKWLYIEDLFPKEGGEK